jgi:hypothetical protein
MRTGKIIITIFALAAISIAAFYGYQYEHRREAADTCPFCDRMVHSITAFRLTVDQHEVAACCPRCGMHAMLNHEHGTTGNAWATDVDTGEKISADSATYVEGGDVRYCVHDDEPAPREPNGASVREFDRCLPTLVAFKTAREAGDYQHQHGGRVLTYAQALASVQEQ